MYISSIPLPPPFISGLVLSSRKCFSPQGLESEGPTTMLLLKQGSRTQALLQAPTTHSNIPIPCPKMHFLSLSLE